MRKLLLVALLCIFTISGAAFAQAETTPVFCGELSDADCAILTHAQTASQSLDSATFDLQFDLTVTDVPDFNSPITVSITGNGAYGGLNNLGAAVLDNTDDVGAMLRDVFQALEFDGSITMRFSRELARTTGLPTSITVEERLIDGMVYLNTDTLRSLTGNSGLRGWYGLDIAAYIDALIRQNPDMFEGSTRNNSAMQDYQDAMVDSDFINRFMSIERTDDRNGDTATFTTNINLPALLNSAEFKDALKVQMEMQGNAMSDAEYGQAMAMLSQMFKGMTFSIQQEIGIEDGFTRQASGSFHFDSTKMMTLMNSLSDTGSLSSGSSAAPKIDLTFSFSYDDFNSAPPVVAPNNPVIIPYQTLLPRSVSA